MTARQTALALAVSLAMAPAGAQADTHKVDVGFALFSYVNQSSLFGVDTSVGFTLHKKAPPSTEPGKAHTPHPWAVVVDLGTHFYGDNDTEITAMAGFRRYAWKRPEKLSGPELAAVEKGAEVHPETKVAVFAQALAGVRHRTDFESKDDRFAAAFGAGLEWLTFKERRWGVRLQGDWIVVANGKDYPRASVFFVYRQPFKD